MGINHVNVLLSTRSLGKTSYQLCKTFENLVSYIKYFDLNIYIIKLEINILNYILITHILLTKQLTNNCHKFGFFRFLCC